MRKSRCTDEQIVAILQEAEHSGKTSETIRRHGISRETFYRWRRKYDGRSGTDDDLNWHQGRGNDEGAVIKPLACLYDQS